MYRNDDGADHGFGDQAVQSSSANQARISVCAAQRTVYGFLTIMVINKPGASNGTRIRLDPWCAASPFSESFARGYASSVPP